jgi:hypothetical protein
MASWKFFSITVFQSLRLGNRTIQAFSRNSVSSLMHHATLHVVQTDLTIEIPPSELEYKIRLLTLASLAFQYVGQNLPYSEIAEALQVDPSEVEKWAIDG